MLSILKQYFQNVINLWVCVISFFSVIILSWPVCFSRTPKSDHLAVRTDGWPRPLQSSLIITVSLSSLWKLYLVFYIIYCRAEKSDFHFLCCPERGFTTFTSTTVIKPGLHQNTCPPLFTEGNSGSLAPLCYDKRANELSYHLLWLIISANGMHILYELFILSFFNKENSLTSKNLFNKRVQAQKGSSTMLSYWQT